MRNSFKLHEAQQTKKEQDLSDWVLPKPCTECGKKLSGAYGRHIRGDQELWTCSVACERSYHANQGRA